MPGTEHRGPDANGSADSFFLFLKEASRDDAVSQLSLVPGGKLEQSFHSGWLAVKPPVVPYSRESLKQKSFTA